MWETLSGILLVGYAILLYFMWKSDRDCDEVTRQLMLTQEELQEAQAEIVTLDDQIEKLTGDLTQCSVEIERLTVEWNESNQSVEHITERLKTSEEIRLQLAASLSGRSNGHQITLGSHDAKVVHGAVVVSDPDVVFVNQCEQQGFRREDAKVLYDPDLLG